MVAMGEVIQKVQVGEGIREEKTAVLHENGQISIALEVTCNS